MTPAVHGSQGYLCGRWWVILESHKIESIQNRPTLQWYTAKPTHGMTADDAIWCNQLNQQTIGSNQLSQLTPHQRIDKQWQLAGGYISHTCDSVIIMFVWKVQSHKVISVLGYVSDAQKKD